MKSTEFISESLFNLDMGEAMATVKRDCQPYLQQNDEPLGNNALLRGLTGGDEFLKKQVRLTDRTPLDNPTDVHNELNKFFTRKYGAPFRNAMFCTGSRRDTRRYGKTYLVFPIGEFKFLWSSDVKDLYLAWDNFNHRNSRSRTKVQDFVKGLEDANYSTTNLKGAISSGAEIMIICESYYALSDYSLPRDRDEINDYEAFLQQ